MKKEKLGTFMDAVLEKGIKRRYSFKNTRFYSDFNNLSTCCNNQCISNNVLYFVISVKK